MGDVAEESARERYCMSKTSVDGVVYCAYCMTKLIYTGPMSLQSGRCPCRCFRCHEQRYVCGCAEYGTQVFAPTEFIYNGTVYKLQCPGISFRDEQRQLGDMAREYLRRRERRKARRGKQ